MPTKNLVSNIGIIGVHNHGESGNAHNKRTLDSDNYIIEKEPPFVVPDYKYDRYFFKNFHLKNRRLHKRIIKRIKKMFN